VKGLLNTELTVYKNVAEPPKMAAGFLYPNRCYIVI